MRRTDSELTGTDQTPLFLRTWTGEGDPRGIVLFIHGLGEHGGRYEELASKVVEAGFVAVAPDHRGHGRSGGLRGHVNDFSQYVGDLLQTVEHMRAEYDPTLPLFVFGHSMGGLIAMMLVLDRPEVRVTGLVMSNPLLGVAVKAPKFKVVLGRVMSRILPKLRLDNELVTTNLSRDPAEVKAYEDDPLVSRLISTRWYTSMLSAMEVTGVRAGELKIPSLWVVSGSDRICNHKRSLSFAESVTGAPVVVKLLPEAYHEPHNGPQRGEVHEALLSWLADNT
jgi:alpha-beta hydrolase superfamily lysophospholipase